MQRKNVMGLSAIAVLLTLVGISYTPALASWQSDRTTIAQAPQSKEAVKLSLKGEKRVVKKNAQGQEIVEWEETQKVQPGDIFKYSVSNRNQTAKEIKNLVVTQPIPAGMTYVLKSATVSQGSQLTYSLDRGKTFVSDPKVPVVINGKTELQPAPANAYTHVRWTMPKIAPNSVITVSYQVRVR